MTVKNDMPRAANSLYKHGFDDSDDLTPEQRERVNKGLSPYRLDTNVSEYKYSKGKFV